MRTLDAQSTEVSAISRVMSDPNWQPTREQVASIIDLLIGSTDEDTHDLIWKSAFAAGYQARVDEENAQYPPPPYSLPTRDRTPVDTTAREGDFKGGLPMPPSTYECPCWEQYTCQRHRTSMKAAA